MDILLYENLFLTKLSFGLNIRNFIILAKDMDDAKSTINNYFDDNCETLYLLSVQKLNELINKVKERDEIFHLVIELGYQVNTKEDITYEEVIINEHEEFGLSFDELYVKYQDKQVIVLSINDIISLIVQTHEELENEENEILISNNFEDYFK